MRLAQRLFLTSSDTGLDSLKLAWEDRGCVEGEAMLPYLILAGAVAVVLLCIWKMRSQSGGSPLGRHIPDSSKDHEE